jgi:hypothetical protein
MSESVKIKQMRKEIKNQSKRIKELKKIIKNYAPYMEFSEE